MQIRRGDIFYADLSPVVGSEQGGIRPVLIIQNDIGNRHSPTVICAAITSRMNKAKLPTHVEIDAGKYQIVKNSVGDYVDRGWLACTITPTGRRLFDEEDIEVFKKNYYRKKTGENEQ